MPHNDDKNLWKPDLWTGNNLDEEDLRQQKLWQREMFDQMYPLLSIKRIDRVKTKLDDIRGEPRVTRGRMGRKVPADRARRYLPPIFYRGYVDHSPKQTTLIRYGFDHPRDAVFTFLNFILEEDNVTIAPGDLVEFEGEEFEILVTRAPTESYWLNTPFKFYLVASGKRFRTEGDRKTDWGGK